MAALAEQEPELDAAVREEALSRATVACHVPASALLLALSVASTALPTAAQDDALLPPTQLLARLKADALTLADAERLAPQLVAQPITVRLQGCDALRAAFLRQTTLHQKATAAFAKDLGPLVAPARDKNAVKRDDEALGALRGKALAVTRREGLTKQAIEGEIDPIVTELEAMLWPSRNTLLQQHPQLATAFAALRDQRATLAKWFAAYGESTVGLELHPGAEKHFAKVPPPPPPPAPTTLDDELTVWRLLATPLSARDRKALEANEALRGAADAEEFTGTTELNRVRWLLGLSLLRIDDKLTLAARDHSQDMATLNFFAHESPVAGKRTPGDRAARFGTSGGAENIANGHDSGASAIRGWWYSPGHHRNMLGGHARTGLGRSGALWTQMFGG
jgi:uncharacterized protein YkwD